MPVRALSVGQVAARSGLPVSTLHFYEEKGLISSERNAANHRIYQREVLRRIAIIKVAQTAGISLADIKQSLSVLPAEKSPSIEEWGELSAAWRDDLTRRIDQLTSLRDKMTDCIGCGCLSISKCALFNDDDHLAGRGAGAHLL
ncbi:MAG: redox-sensitive transcriptional activator SoxR [Pseudomonadota bacterium]